MPNLTFVLPHWMYWSGLILFPLLAGFLFKHYHRDGEEQTGTSATIAYMLWLTGGFVGLHRFYLRAPLLAFLFIALFVGILYGNRISGETRIVVSGVKNQILDAEYDRETIQRDIANAEEGAQAKLAALDAHIAALGERLVQVEATWAAEQRYTLYLGILVAVLLLIDLTLIPGMTRRAQAADPPPKVSEHAAALAATRDTPLEDPTVSVHSRITDMVDQLSGFSGHLVAYWSVIAVLAYYYEVIARYVFNSPTNWAHESMFLMFGMQYLLSGAFALREDSHVRVDVIYVYFSDRAKVIVDICTSLFFFIFVVALLWTGWIFAVDAIDVWEVSLTEWAIQYWPVKMTIALGAFLLLLQGLAKLTKDFILLTARGA